MLKNAIIIIYITIKYSPKLIEITATIFNNL